MSDDPSAGAGVATTVSITSPTRSRSDHYYCDIGMLGSRRLLTAVATLAIVRASAEILGALAANAAPAARTADPLARRGRLGLTVVYAHRVLRGVRATPAAARALHATRPLPTPLEVVRTAAWTVRALRHTRAALASTGRPTALPAAPTAPAAHPIVLLVLSSGRARCLSRSAVRQAWLAAQGDLRDLVVSVTAPSTGFRAHAWLDGDPDGAGFTELSRSPAPAGSSSPSA